MTLPWNIRDNGYAATVEFQGNRMQVKVQRPYIEPAFENQPEPRGKIVSFSARSRKRLLDYCASIAWQGQKAVFITLTYPSVFPNPKTAKNHLRAFLERIRRRFPKASAIWRLEFQKRGAPHFHLLFFNLPFVPKETIQKWWGEIIDYENPFTRIELIKSWRKAMSYVSKYIAKTDDTAEGGFNYLPYLHGLGRVWGFFNKELIPFAVKIVVKMDILDRQFYQYRRYCKKLWKRIKMQGFPVGWTLYFDNLIELRHLFAMSHNLPACT